MIGEITPFDLRWPVVVASLLIAVSSFGHLEVPTLHIKAAKSASELHNLYNTIYIFIPRWTNQSSVCHEFKNTGACLMAVSAWFPQKPTLYTIENLSICHWYVHKWTDPTVSADLQLQITKDFDILTNAVSFGIFNRFMDRNSCVVCFELFQRICIRKINGSVSLI